MKIKDKKKDGFILYASQYESIKDLTLEQKGVLLDSVFLYVIGDAIPDIVDGEVKMAFKFIKTQIDMDCAKYERIKEIRAEAGRRHRGNQYGTNGTNGTSVPFDKQMEQMEHKDKDKDKDKDSQEPKGSMSEDSTLLTEGMSDSGAAPTRPKTIRQTVIAYFNDKMKGKEIKSIRSIADGTQRAEWLKKRIELYGLSAVYEVIDKAAESSFLNGGNKRGWTATFDWLIRPNNFPKVLDGNYDDEKITETMIEQQTDWQS